MAIRHPTRAAHARTAPAVRASPRVAIVVSRYNASITDRLQRGAMRAYAERLGRRGRGADRPHIVDAPGSFELPALAHAAASTGWFDGVLALGCIIKGQTSHDQYLAQAVANGLVNATIATGVPIAFGVLTVDTPEQARAREGGAHGNKGEEAMHALLDTMAQIARVWRAGTAHRAARSIPRRPDKALAGRGRVRRSGVGGKR